MEMRAAAPSINAAHYQEALDVEQDPGAKWGVVFLSSVAQHWSRNAATSKMPEEPWRWSRRICSIRDCIRGFSQAVSGIRIWEPDMAMKDLEMVWGTVAASVCVLNMCCPGCCCMPC